MHLFRAWSLPFLLGTASLALAGDNGFQKRPHDWPQWLGPGRDALCRETGLLRTWPKAGPALQWKAHGLGEGFSTPSIAAGRVFTMGNRGQTEFVIALREKDGTELWATAVGPVRSQGGGYPGPRCTPTVDGDRVYALGLNGDLLCLAVRDGQEQWRKDLTKDFSGQPGGWGYTESPLIDGDKLICTPGGRKATLVALNKRDGRTVWTAQVPNGDHAGYASVVAAEVDGHRQYVQFLSRGVVGVAAEDGKFLWRFNDPANGTANISTAVVHGDHVFAASNYGRGGALAHLTGAGGSARAEVVYFTSNMQNHHGGMVLVDGYLYGADGGQLACLEFKTGKVMWESGKPGKGSIVFADGRLYYRNEGHRGTVYLIEANPREYVEVAHFDQPERSRRNAWAHPVIANGCLYIADQDVLFCYDVKQHDSPNAAR
jgi:outer membrane protein assembly factor BamB